MTDSTAGRRRRSDARANHEKLLDAAEQFFATQGLDASLRLLADEAGVGIGTLYRNFPSRLDLVRALRDRILPEMDEVVAAAAQQPTGWEQLLHYIDGGVRLTLAHPLMHLVSEWLRRHDPGYQPEDRWNAQIVASVAQAHAEGTLRPDATATDVALVPHMLSSLALIPEPMRTVMIARQRSVLLVGLRSGAADPLPGGALSTEELAAVVGRTRG
jgi:AcrR family transcriptional regulator